VREGKHAIVVYVDGSATSEKIIEEQGFRVLKRKAGKEVRLFSGEFGLPPEVHIFNPE
jgi:hypothetical protein